MALTLVSILTLATVALAVPVIERDVACTTTYYSVAGDTCMSIGLSFGFYDTDILNANTFLDCDDIWPGTPICIPDISDPLPTPVCAQTYQSVAGDTCDTIGAQFGVTGSDIYNANDFLNCTDIWINTPICVPVAPDPSPTSSSCKATYWSVAGDTCQSIGALWGYDDSQISAANAFLNCSDIWANTPICIPDIPTATAATVVPAPTCMTTYTSGPGDTCDSIGAQYGISGTAVYSANTFLDCSNIWTYTPLCIPNVVADPFPSNTTTVDPTDSATSDSATSNSTGPAATATDATTTD